MVVKLKSYITFDQNLKRLRGRDPVVIETSTHRPRQLFQNVFRL